MNARNALLAAGMVGATSVLFGAFGAHWLHDLLTQHGTGNIWETGVRYHLLHSAALFAAAAWLKKTSDAPGSRRIGWAAQLWLVGTILFSGSLYWLALGGPHFLVFVTPLGGLSLVAGWLFVVGAAVASDE